MSPYAQWWRVDLGANYNVSKINVVNYYKDARYYKYDIEASKDGNSWTKIADFTTNTALATSEGKTFNLNNVVARYLRVNMKFNSANIGVHRGQLTKSKKTGLRIKSIMSCYFDSCYELFILNGLNSPGLNVTLLFQT